VGRGDAGVGRGVSGGGGGADVFVGGGGGGAGVFVGGGGGGAGVFVGGGGCVFAGGGGGGGGVSAGSTGVCVGVGTILLRVGVGTTLLGVSVGVGRGNDVAVGSSSHGVELGERVGVGEGTTVLAMQNSVTSGSSPGLTYISRHVGSVSVFVSSAQVTAPSSTARRVVSPLISTLILEGTLKSVTEQAGIMNSYEGSCATNRRLPSCNVICKRGKVCGFCTSTTASEASSSVLPSPRQNRAPSSASAMIWHLSSIVILAWSSIVVRSEASGHCNCAFPAHRCSCR